MAAQKKIILIVTPEVEEARRMMFGLAKQFEDVTVFHAVDGQDALTKMRNAVPRVLITDLELPKVSGQDLLRETLSDPALAGVGVLVLSDIPDHSSLADDVVRGKLKAISKPVDLNALFEAVSGILAKPMGGHEATFQIRFLSPGDLIFKEGEKAECAFLVKKGKLRAYRSGIKKVTLGTISAGEFLGEMAYINGEPRSATVEALEESELVEIPLGTLDLLIFSKPAWTKALLKTLAARLHEANQKKGLRAT
ncbi:MAG: cyclic nucleotide-binding domain-containing protein [Proteobacteria bacterium]|nr:MAG: cyclic nucleotide-binding domain-containing protein [Pseudomonadota bacterium]